MAAWHLLDDAELRGRYLAGDEAGRLAVLEEILRLEPVVGHLYRRAQEAVEVSDGEQRWTIPPGDLVDVCVRATNTDERAVGAAPLDLCPGRGMPRGVDGTGLAFGDGEHRCPGQPLALRESDVLLRALLALEPEVVRAPQIGWDHLVEGYTLRGMELRLG